MANCLNVCVVILATLGLGLLIVSASTNYWRSYEIGSIKYHQGLFKGCVTWKDSVCGKLFKDLGDAPAKFAGVIATMILAIIFQGLSMIIGSVATLVNKKWNAVVAVFNGLSVISGAAALAIYAKYYDNQVYKLDWSYALGWLGTCCVGIELVLVCIIMMR